MSELECHCCIMFNVRRNVEIGIKYSSLHANPCIMNIVSLREKPFVTAQNTENTKMKGNSEKHKIEIESTKDITHEHNYQPK